MKKNKILRILNKAMEEKREGNVVNKPKKKIIFKYKNFLNKIKDIFNGKVFINLLRSEKVSDALVVVRFILGYGIIGYLAYYTLFIRTYWYLTLLGCGAIIYLFQDFFDFIWSRVKVIWAGSKK